MSADTTHPETTKRRPNSVRNYTLLGAGLLLVFAGFSYSAFQDSLTPYVSYELARDASRVVQVAGGLEKNSWSYEEDGGLRFTLLDEELGDSIRVRYDGIKPANFEDAVSIVAIGRFDAGTSEFAADKLLVKCPSKYQGLAEEHPDSIARPGYTTG